MFAYVLCAFFTFEYICTVTFYYFISTVQNILNYAVQMQRIPIPLLSAPPTNPNTLMPEGGISASINRRGCLSRFYSGCKSTV